MGSIARGNAIERFINKYGEQLVSEFSELLLGKKVVRIENINADYYVKGQAVLDDNSICDVHYRWTSQEEDAEGAECDPDIMKMEDYYDKYIVGREIIEIDIGYERDDDCCIYAYVQVGEVGENICLEIPVGIDPECGVEEDGTPIDMGSNDEEIIHNIINNCYEPND